MRITLAFCLMTLLCGEARATTAERPNIVVILADDLGFSDIGCYGGEIATPNLNRLADEGVRFTQFYNTARCCPTRAALLTGLYQHQAGVGLMINDRGLPGYRGFLSDRCATIAEVLGDAGYATLMAGKWHVGEDRPHWPRDRGFERYFGLISGACSYWELMPGRQMALDDEPWRPDPNDDSFYMTDAFTNYAVDFLKESAGDERPFFLYLAYTAPHWPLHAWPEDIAKYRGKYRGGWDELRRRRHRRMIDLGIVEAKWPLSPRHDQVPAWEDVEDADVQDLRMAVYAAMVDRMDQNIGRIVATLDQLGVRKNTLLLFLSDNGGCHKMVNRGRPGIPPGPKGGYWGYDYPWANASNTPLRMFKQYTHEGGIASPLVCNWPAGIKAGGQLTHQPGHVIDIMATCLDVAGADYPQQRDGHDLLPLEGRSLLPAMQDPAFREHRTLYWEHKDSKAIRDGDWKLVADRHNRKWELYNLAEDRTELHDQSALLPDKTRELADAWDAWAARVGVVEGVEQQAKAVKRK